uniref:Uncharacterized protein n=1 Tax=Guillardia theta TaxID=55529 RepID=A0A7S4UNJ5_GUITH
MRDSTQNAITLELLSLPCITEIEVMDDWKVDKLLFELLEQMSFLWYYETLGLSRECCGCFNNNVVVHNIKEFMHAKVQHSDFIIEKDAVIDRDVGHLYTVVIGSYPYRQRVAVNTCKPKCIQ